MINQFNFDDPIFIGISSDIQVKNRLSARQQCDILPLSTRIERTGKIA